MESRDADGRRIALTAVGTEGNEWICCLETDQALTCTYTAGLAVTETKLNEMSAHHRSWFTLQHGQYYICPLENASLAVWGEMVEWGTQLPHRRGFVDDMRQWLDRASSERAASLGAPKVLFFEHKVLEHLRDWISPLSQAKARREVRQVEEFHTNMDKLVDLIGRQEKLLAEQIHHNDLTWGEIASAAAPTDTLSFQIIATSVVLFWTAFRKTQPTRANLGMIGMVSPTWSVMLQLSAVMPHSHLSHQMRALSSFVGLRRSSTSSRR